VKGIALWRAVAGVAVLAALGGFAVLLIPAYVSNLKLQQFMEESLRDPQAAQRPPEALRIAVADRAARLGLPVKEEQVTVTRTGDQLAVEVRYFVRVDLPLYTVDLHFRPRAGH
jgi:hypothetical protein